MLCRERDTGPQQVNPLTVHIAAWFADLNSARSFTIIAGMGGGGCIPNAIGYQEISAWAELTGNRPTPWEVNALRSMDQSWRGAYNDKQGGGKTAATRQHQGIGDYCNGARIDACRKQFGVQLDQVCATCPN